jgi:hypothetical protein
MATSAQFTAQPILEYVQISTANTNRDGTGTLGTVCTGPNTSAGNGVGKRIFRVVVQSTGTTTAGVVRFFISNDNGSSIRMVCEKIVPAVTPSTTVAAWRTEVAELVGMILPGGTGNILYASTNNAETFNVICESGTL